MDEERGSGDGGANGGKLAPNKSQSSFPLPRSHPDPTRSSLRQPPSLCSDCFPFQANPPESSSSSSSFVDLLQFSAFGGIPWSLTSGRKDKPWRYLADIRYTFTTGLGYSYPSVEIMVLASPIVSRSVEQLTDGDADVEKTLFRRAKSQLKQMSAHLSKFVCRICGYLLFKVFRRLMARLLVCPAQMEQLKRAAETGMPVVYLPLHRSHLDYLLITWTAWHFDLQLPHIASGDNLNLSGLGWLLRCTGAFFIRRRSTSNKREKMNDDQLYRGILNAYLVALLQCNLSIEFFLEGMSRFGKALLPKNGLISNVVDAVRHGEVADVWLVPVAYAYNSVAEGIFLDELMGQKKRRESVWGVFKAVWTGFKRKQRCGTVRIDFGCPIKLTDYITALKDALQNSRDQFHLHHRPLLESYRELLPWHDSVSTDRTLIRAMGYHVIYDAQRLAAISTPSVISALILCKYRSGGGNVEALGEDLEWLCEEMITLGFDVMGWIWRQTSGMLAIQEAQEYLPLSEETSLNEILLNGCGTLSHGTMLALAYNKNSIVHIYAIHSVVALALLSFSSPDSSVDDLIDLSLRICDVLQMEVIFCKPCENLHDKIRRMISDVFGHSYCGMLTITGQETSPVFKIGGERERSLLQFYANILRPFLQSLFITASHIANSTDISSVSDNDFVSLLIIEYSKGPQLSFHLFDECLNADSIRNSLKLLREKDAIAADMPRSLGGLVLNDLLVFIERVLVAD